MSGKEKEAGTHIDFSTHGGSGTVVRAPCECGPRGPGKGEGNGSQRAKQGSRKLREGQEDGDSGS